ncbi:MAG: dicarboxylate/amino acid:cation symporter [Holosporales bacterium]|jgi:Na+/H+-dicarboxylate symporter|nr:dicarboxylate/amino acid:cation symporter [Holosporales bacterium]
MPFELTKRLKNLVFNPLVQLIMVLIVASACYTKLHPDTVRFFLTISTCLKELLVFVLPFLLFSFVAVALSSIPKDGMLFVLGLMAVVFLSNFVNVLLSGTVGFLVLSGAEAHVIPEPTTVFLPFFDARLPHIAETAESLFLGVAVGLFNSFRPNRYISAVINFVHGCVMKFMKNFFVPLLPIFVGGFLLKLLSEGKMLGFVENNTKVCIITCGFLWAYLGLWLLTASSFRLGRAAEIFKTTFPAIVTAFSSMSSAAALPLSLNAAEKNTQDKMLADAVMPMTLNFHMVGDTIIVPIMALMVMLAFNHPLPSVHDFVLFGLFFILNKFAGGGVPSGTIMVTVPVLEKYLGFDSSMTAFIIALYGVIDPIASSGNVAANNFFIIIFQKIRNLAKKARPRTQNV